MDFFRSLNEVRKNSSQLDRWEQQQRDKDAQRKAYQAKHAPTPEEIEKAKELGDTLINVIDVMDDHSESVAENVETIAEPISTVSLLASGGITAYLAYNLGIKPANKQLKAMKEAFDRDQKNIDFAENLSKNASIKLGNGEILDNVRFSSSELRGSKRGLERITDDKLKYEAIEINKAWKKSISKLKTKQKLAFWAVPVAAITGWIMGNIYETKLQVDSSRIARFQARRDLKDPKAFVKYTPEQIAQAKAELEKHPERIKKEQKSKLKKGLFSSLRELIRDNDNYKQTRKLREKQQSMVTRPLTEAEILEAKKDQEVIQRVVKIINNEAEKNSEKMETTADVIMGTFPIVGSAIGFLATLGLEKTGLIKKWVGNYVNKHGSQEAKDAYKELSKLKRNDPKYDSAWKEFFGEFSGMPQTKKQWEKHWKNDRLRNEVENLSKGDKKAKAIKKMKDLFAGAMVHKTRGRWFIGLAAGLLAAFPSSIIALKLQKDAARAGRFTAKRELEKDPTNFIGYADTELEEVKDVKSTKKQESKIKEYALFIPRVIKDWWAYNKYKNNELKEKLALNAELKKLDVTDEQLRDAKNLQSKVFNTFDKVDDNSQAYSEATEAAIQTAQPFVIAGGYLTAISPLIYFGIQASRGKYTNAKIAEKVTNVFAKFSNLLDTKLFKGYLKGVDKHVAKVVADTDTTSTKYGEMLKDIDILETPIVEIITKGMRNKALAISRNFANMNDWEQNSTIYNFISKIDKHFRKDIISLEKLEEIKNAAREGLEIHNATDLKISYAISDIVYGSGIKDIDADILSEAQRRIGKTNLAILEKHNRNKNTISFIHHIENTLTGIKDTRLKSDVVSLVTLNKYAIEEMTPEQFTNAKNFLIKNFLTKENADSISEFLKEISVLKEDFIPKGINLDSIIGDEKITSTLDKMPKIKEALEGLLTKIQDFEIPQKSGDELIEALTKSTEKEDIIKLFNKLPDLTNVLNGEKLPLRLKDIPGVIEDAAAIAKGVKASGNMMDTVLGTTSNNSTLMRLLDNADVITNPKAGFEKLAKAIQEMDEQSYIEFMRKTPMRGWEKDSVVKIIGNISKVWENIPKEQFKNIMGTIIKQFNENPDKTMEAVKSGSIMKMFMTPQIKKALATAGITWTVFTAVMTYIVSSWLAELQLRAGRLGVKKAMDDLQDHRYYADVIPDETAQIKTAKELEAEKAQTQEVIPPTQNTTNSNLLTKFKH